MNLIPRAVYILLIFMKGVYILLMLPKKNYFILFSFLQKENYKYYPKASKCHQTQAETCLQNVWINNEFHDFIVAIGKKNPFIKLTLFRNIHKL